MIVEVQCAHKSNVPVSFHSPKEAVTSEPQYCFWFEREGGKESLRKSRFLVP